MRYFTILLSFILLLHLSDLSAQRSSSNKSGRKTDKKTARTVVTADSTATKTDTTATKDKKKTKSGRTSTKSARTSSSSWESLLSSVPLGAGNTSKQIRIVSTTNVHGETEP